MIIWLKKLWTKIENWLTGTKTKETPVRESEAREEKMEELSAQAVEATKEKKEESPVINLPTYNVSAPKNDEPCVLPRTKPMSESVRKAIQEDSGLSRAGNEQPVYREQVYKKPVISTTTTLSKTTYVRQPAVRERVVHHYYERDDDGSDILPFAAGVALGNLMSRNSHEHEGLGAFGGGSSGGGGSNRTWNEPEPERTYEPQTYESPTYESQTYESSSSDYDSGSSDWD